VELGIPGIIAAKPMRPSLDEMRAWLATLERGLEREERESIYRIMEFANAVGFGPGSRP
jgi:hypothetical protein